MLLSVCHCHQLHAKFYAYSEIPFQPLDVVSLILHPASALPSSLLLSKDQSHHYFVLGSLQSLLHSTWMSYLLPATWMSYLLPCRGHDWMLYCWKTHLEDWTGCGEVGRQVPFVCASVGLKSRDAQSWNQCPPQYVMEALSGYQQDDPDMWMRPMAKVNGCKNWEYLLHCVDDISCIPQDSTVVVDYLSRKAYLEERMCKAILILMWIPKSRSVWTINAAGHPTKWKGQCCPTLAQVRHAVTGIERELEEIGERLSKKMLTTMRDGDATLIDTTRIWIPSVQSIPGFDWGITSDLWFWSMSLWTLQCCRVSSLHWEGDLWTGLSISLPTCNGTIGWAWSLMMRRSQVWHASAYVTGMIAALVCAKLCCQVLRLMSGVIANDGLLCWHKLCWLICCKGCLKADFWITCWIGGTHGCQGCSERIEWLYGL